MVDAETNVELSRLISMEELQEVMKCLTHDKILGRDGWLVKLFLHFKDLMGLDILDMAKES